MITVTCTVSGCPAENVAYSVPEDGYPVTCGGCSATLTAAA